MYRVIAVYRRDIAEIVRSTVFRVVVALYGAVALGCAVTIGVALARFASRLESAGAPDPAEILRMLIPNLVLGMGGILAVSIAYLMPIWVFGSTQMTREKASRTVESVLATPLTPIEFWLGKSLALFVPGTIMALFGSAAFVLVPQAWASVATGSSLLMLPAPVALTLFLATPVAYLWMALLTTGVSMALGPDAAIAPSLLLGFASMIGIPIAAALQTVRFDTWNFAAILGGAAVIATALLIPASRMLNSERILRSL